jgi:chromosome segregation ATPase
MSRNRLRTSSRPPPKAAPPDPPIVPDPQSADVEELLAQHRSFIQQNQHRLPHFSNSAEAEAQVRELQAQLKSLEAQQSPRTPKAEIDRRLSEIARQHETISDEDRRIAELRLVSQESGERETREYSDILREIGDSKSQLTMLTNRLGQRRQAARDAQEAVTAVENDVNDRKRQIERLRNEERQLRDGEKESRSELQAIEKALRELADGDEQNVKQLEEIGDNRAETLRTLQATLLEKRAAVRSKNAEIESLLEEIEGIERELDRTITTRFGPSESGRNRQVGGTSDEIEEAETRGPSAANSEMEEVVQEAKGVLDLPLLDPRPVKQKVETVTGKWQASSTAP